MKITQQQQMYYNKNRTGEGKTKLNLSLKHNVYLPGAMSLAAAKFDVFLHRGLYGSIS